MSWHSEDCEHLTCNVSKSNKKSGFCKNHYMVYKHLMYSGMGSVEAEICVKSYDSPNGHHTCHLSKWREDMMTAGYNPEDYCNHKMGRGLGLCNKHLLMCSRHCHDSNTNILDFIDQLQKELCAGDSYIWDAVRLAPSTRKQLKDTGNTSGNTSSSSTGTPAADNPQPVTTASGLAAIRRYNGTNVGDNSLVQMTMKIQGVGTEAYTFAYSLLQNTWIKRDKYSFLQLDEVKLIINPILQKRYDDYKASMPTDVHEQSVFHGCSEEVVDSIAEHGLKKEFWRSSAGDWQRFGPGFYFAPHSSKSHEYPLDQMSAISPGEHTRTMLLCKVVAGRTLTTKHNMDSLQGSAPSGYNSILGLASSDGPLNFDELVVFDEAAIIPYATVNYRFIKCCPVNPVNPTLPQGSDNDWSEMIQGERLNVVDNGMGLRYSSKEEAITAALNTPSSVGIWMHDKGSFHVLRSGHVREWGVGVPNDTVHRVWRRVDRSPKKAPEPSNICSICQDDCDSNPLSCGHHFHKECLLKWTQTGRSLGNSCPNCRKQFDISVPYLSPNSVVVDVWSVSANYWMVGIVNDTMIQGELCVISNAFIPGPDWRLLKDSVWRWCEA